MDGRTQAQHDLDIIIPAYNEELRLSATLAAVTAYLARTSLRCCVIVVDNGSTDATADIARRWANGPVPVRLIGCSRQGKGAAVRRGIRSTTARWVGFCDADCATSLDALSAVIVGLTKGASVVIGSRRLATAELLVPHGPIRRLGSHGFRTMVRRLVPGVSDTQCGFKFFQGDIARDLFSQCTCDGFAFDVEVLARAVRAGHPVLEVPVSWTAQAGSTFRVVFHGYAAARDLIQISAGLRSVGDPSTLGSLELESVA